MSNSLAPPPHVFPLVRQLSWRLSGLLLRMPIKPNQVTATSLVLGLTGNWLLLSGDSDAYVVAALFMTLYYVLDNCDGDIARVKKLQSEFGRRFDTFVDWLVNASFFICLGAGEAARHDDDLWLWLGAIGTAGGTINYLIVLYLEAREGVAESSTAEPCVPEFKAWWDLLLFVFREIFRSDFCFLVLMLALADALWLLLPAGALGAQVYWMTAFIKRSRDYHV